ncbi:MAG: hypothetical protein ACLQOZ_00185 [Acidimicrobiales bacterium]|jgi:hypothetical protein
MRTSPLRRRIAVAGTVGVTALIATMGLGAGVASATPTDPPGGATPVAPSFNNGVVNTVRGSGSDTTFFMMQKISDLYTSAGLYGCTLNTGTGNTLYNTGFTSSGTNAEYYCQANDNATTTDTADNWSRTEVSEGVDDVGSTAGQEQLCGSTVLASPYTVDFARSSKPAGTYCSGLVETGYAKDSVPAVEFQISPASVGTATFSTYAAVNGGNIGDVAKGWEPGDALAGPFTGTAFANLSNADNTGGSNSTAYRLWCAHGLSNQITDWGQLTNLGPNLAAPNVTLTNGSTTATLSNALPANVTGGASEIITDLTTSGNLASGTYVSSVSGTTVTLSQAATGSGTDNLSIAIGTAEAVGSGGAIGLPVRILGVNPSSGTEATWASYAESGVSGGGCASNTNGSAEVDPNSSTATGDNAGPHVALENNASQIGDFGAADFPGDYADQAVELATTLYYESNGVYSSNPYSGAATINATTYAATKLSLNSKTPTTTAVLNNLYPTARTLFNVYNTATVKASTAGFLNWICDSQTAITKQKDNSTGINFDTELNSIITSFGFTRLTDTSAVASGGNTPPDNISGGGINTSCASGLNTGSTAGNGTPPITAVENPEG